MTPMTTQQKALKLRKWYEASPVHRELVYRETDSEKLPRTVQGQADLYDALAFYSTYPAVGGMKNLTFHAHCYSFLLKFTDEFDEWMKNELDLLSVREMFGQEFEQALLSRIIYPEGWGGDYWDGYSALARPFINDCLSRLWDD